MRAAMAGEVDVDRAVEAARAALAGDWGKTQAPSGRASCTRSPMIVANRAVAGGCQESTHLPVSRGAGRGRTCPPRARAGSRRAADEADDVSAGVDRGRCLRQPGHAPARARPQIRRGRSATRLRSAIRLRAPSDPGLPLSRKADAAGAWALLEAVCGLTRTSGFPHPQSAAHRMRTTRPGTHDPCHHSPAGKGAP